MGQYYYIVCPDLKEYLHPHDFGEGLKLLEFATGSCTILTGLAILLADGNGRGGGDLRVNDKFKYKKYIGRWANHRVVIAGDYADPAPRRKQINPKGFKCNFSEIANTCYRNISLPVIMCLLQDEYVKARWIKRESWEFNSSQYKDKILEELGKE